MRRPRSPTATREKEEPCRHEREPREIKEREPVPAVAEAEPAAEPEPFEEERPSISETQIKFRDMINELAHLQGQDPGRYGAPLEVPVRELVNTFADATGVVAGVRRHHHPAHP